MHGTFSALDLKPVGLDRPAGEASLRLKRPVSTLTLNRPGQRNALREADLIEILRLFGEINADERIRVLVIRANTEGQAKPVFCAGYSLDDFDSPEHEAARFGRVADALANLRPVTIAVLNGSVYGGATDLALACDLRLALAGTEWRMPACALGLHFYPGGLQRYVSHLGPSRAKQAFLQAQPMPVSWLAEAGLFAAVCDSVAELDAAADAAVKNVLSLSPMAAQMTKATLTEMAAGRADMAQVAAREQACAASEAFANAKAAAKKRRTG